MIPSSKPRAASIKLFTFTQLNMHAVIRGFPFSHIHDLHNIWMSRYFGLIFAIALFFSDKVYIGPLFPWTFEECGQSPPNDNFK